MHDSCLLHPKPPLMRVLGWQCSSRYALWCFSRHQHPCTLHILPTSVMPPTTNPTPLLVKKGLHIGLALENMLVMLSPTNFLMMTPTKSSTDLLSDPQILLIPTRDWHQMEGRASRHPNPLFLTGLGKMIVNLLPNPWQNITLITLLAGPFYSQRMNKEKGLEPLSREKSHRDI